MAKPVQKPAAVAASREETESLIGHIGQLYRDKTKLGLDYGAKLAELKAEYEAAIARIDQEIAEAETKVRGWCAVNRNSICKPGQKSARFPTGVVKFRVGRKRVLVVDAEKALAYIKKHELTKFIRTKEELNQQALLDDEATAETIPGITIERAPDDIVINPITPD